MTIIVCDRACIMWMFVWLGVRPAWGGGDQCVPGWGGRRISVTGQCWCVLEMTVKVPWAAKHTACLRVCADCLVRVWHPGPGT